MTHRQAVRHPYDDILYRPELLLTSSNEPQMSKPMTYRRNYSLLDTLNTKRVGEKIPLDKATKRLNQFLNPTIANEKAALNNILTNETRNQRNNSTTTYDLFLRSDINKLKIFYQSRRVRPDNIVPLGPDAMKVVLNLAKQYNKVLDYSWGLQLANYAVGKVDFIYSDSRQAAISSGLGLQTYRPININDQDIKAIFIDLDYVNENLNREILDIMYEKRKIRNFTFIFSTVKRISDIYEYIGRNAIYDRITRYQPNASDKLRGIISDEDIDNVIAKLFKEPIPSDNRKVEEAIRETAAEQQATIRAESEKDRGVIRQTGSDQAAVITRESDRTNQSITDSAANIVDTIKKVDEFQFKIVLRAKKGLGVDPVGSYAVMRDEVPQRPHDAPSPTVFKILEEYYRNGNPNGMYKLQNLSDGTIVEVHKDQLRLITGFYPLTAEEGDFEKEPNDRILMISLRSFGKANYAAIKKENIGWSDMLGQGLKSLKGSRKLTGGAMKDVRFPRVSTFERAYVDVVSQKNIYVFSL